MCRANEGIYVWNARGNQGYLSDGTSSGLDKITRKTIINSITDDKRFVTEPQCSQLICKPISVMFHIKDVVDISTQDANLHGVICKGFD